MKSGDNKKEPDQIGLKGVEEALAAFEDLGRDDPSLDQLFPRLKSRYETLDEREKEGLFRGLIEQIEVSKPEIDPLLEALLRCPQGDPRWASLLAEFRKHAYSPRLRLFRKISRSPGGLKFLLDFRGDLLSTRRHSRLDLNPLDSDIVFLFEMLFQEGFLYLEEITLDSAYKQIELIKNLDMVHPMARIEEMGQRLGRDRRCFGLYHRLIPYEPIIFIEVALTEGLIRNISQIMAAGAGSQKARVDTAIFYSINNTQNGLAGLGLGKILIGRVVDYLRNENERIKNFATLSPVPGFWKGYLRPLLEGKDESFDLKHNDVMSFFSKKGIGKIMEASSGEGERDHLRFNRALLSVLSDESWAMKKEFKDVLRGPLVKIAYHYVANEKNPQNKPLNPVASFHLGNGATVSERDINFLANPSSRGLIESCGIMVNYIYSSSWLSQVRRSLRWFDRVEIKGLFGRSA
jgi:malonyl-CoA decarboxylase